MCIIVVKPCGINTPPSEVLEECFESNPDGAGLMIYNPTNQAKEATIYKGIMHCDSYLDLCERHVTKDMFAIYHFRIGTSGGNTPQNCHPFPVSDDIKDLKALIIHTKHVFVHNGILGAGDDIRGLSDTQLYIKDSLVPYIQATEHEDLPITLSCQDFLASTTKGSRCILFDAETNTYCLTGDWLTDNKYPGILFSNTSYKPYPVYRHGVWQDAWYDAPSAFIAPTPSKLPAYVSNYKHDPRVTTEGMHPDDFYGIWHMYDGPMVDITFRKMTDKQFKAFYEGYTTCSGDDILADLEQEGDTKVYDEISDLMSRGTIKVPSIICCDLYWIGVYFVDSVLSDRYDNLPYTHPHTEAMRTIDTTETLETAWRDAM